MRRSLALLVCLRAAAGFAVAPARSRRRHAASRSFDAPDGEQRAPPPPPLSVLGARALPLAPMVDLDFVLSRGGGGAGPAARDGGDAWPAALARFPIRAGWNSRTFCFRWSRVRISPTPVATLRGIGWTCASIKRAIR